MERDEMTVIRKRWLLIFIGLSAFGFVLAQEKIREFENITAKQVYEKIQKGENLLLLDVRTEEEYHGPLGHIDSSLLIPLQDIARRYRELLPYKNREIIVYCRSGNRSQAATAFLMQKGFKVKNMLGGIKAWNRIINRKK